MIAGSGLCGWVMAHSTCISIKTVLLLWLLACLPACLPACLVVWLLWLKLLNVFIPCMMTFSSPVNLSPTRQSCPRIPRAHTIRGSIAFQVHGTRTYIMLWAVQSSGIDSFSMLANLCMLTIAHVQIVPNGILHCKLIYPSP